MKSGKNIKQEKYKTRKLQNKKKIKKGYSQNTISLQKTQKN